jgi:peptidoglycan/xylan/chitin deacetylase (PgdA/CDA1 family)
MSRSGYVGLTFDDGPDPVSTRTLLDVLSAVGARATMFNIGQHARDHQALVQAQRDAGMWIGNHTWSHPHLTTRSSARARSELRQTQIMLEEVSGILPRLFRPPYGDTNATVRALAQRLGLTEILWDVDSRDWDGASTAQIVAAASTLRDGQIMLMHDGYANTIAALPRIVADLASRGLRPGMISPVTGRAVAPVGGTEAGPG